MIVIVLRDDLAGWQRLNVTAFLSTADLFATGGDEENRAAVAAVPRDGLDLVGVAVHAPRNAADKIVKGARMAA